ncbi:type II toxin-antitoxin system RelE/ParE family toxin [archaeon]|jgi:mRNA interferase RelE/StbE|nr:type II toxin-antitoxin system RelE/ParE family toxin [archaeon]
MYEIIFEKKALKQFKKLEKGIKNRIWNKIQQCKINPFIYLEHLEDISGYKLKVGDYRVILDVSVKIKIISILKVGHRKNIYK